MADHNESIDQDLAIEDLLWDNRYKRDYTPKQDIVVLRIGGKIVGTLDSFISFSGAPKSGKSTFIGAMVASSFIQQPIFNISVTFPTNKNRIVYFDTESSEYDFYKHIDRIRSLSHGVMPDSYDMYRCRDWDPEMLKRNIEYYLKTRLNTAIVVIDGILDLIMNFNDEYESKRLINWLKSITAKYLVCIVCVLHTGKKDANTLGHLGSAMDRYTQSTLYIERDVKENSSTIAAKFMRSDLPFDPIKIAWTNGGYKEV